MRKLFALIDRGWMAPALDRCGSAVVARTRVRGPCPQGRVLEWGANPFYAAGEEPSGLGVCGILPVQSSVSATIGARLPLISSNCMGTIWDGRWSRANE